MTFEPATEWEAARIAKDAHEGQFRRDENTPYFVHVCRVANRMKHDDEDGRIVAYLHDILEDTTTTPEDLRKAGFSQTVREAVQALTHHPDDSYEFYLAQVRANPLAIRVKIADIQDNISDNPTRSQMRKYAKALLYLLE